MSWLLNEIIMLWLFLFLINFLSFCLKCVIVLGNIYFLKVEVNLEFIS